MMSIAQRAIDVATPALVANFQRDGAVCLRGLLSADELVTLQRGIDSRIPVDPVARPSTLAFVAGSHRGPWLMPRTCMHNEARWFPEGSLADRLPAGAPMDDALFPLLVTDGLA